ncbi:MAG: aminoglycoside phosphotransferase family protein, partial [Deltaproteobacteria bacterium]|nr:aminoglycoside phosphotransferase family protein [Deltaproteobacteria bacterium]
WKKSLLRAPVGINYMEQLLKRSEDILAMHPDIFREKQAVSGLEVPSALILVENCRAWEKTLTAPFTVFGHGDFNINNILFDEVNQSIHFIDLYRSGPADYVADIAVIMISNFRLPIFERGLREKLNLVIAEIYRFAREFAAVQNDHCFDLRLGLALVRSFYTSTRFEQNHKFAREMALRALFLLEKIDSWRKSKASQEAFVLPKDMLYYSV